jgi:hypothetical protein
MNERTTELKSQAYQYADRNTQDGDNMFATLQLEKFAELIVRECAELATAEYNKRGAIHGDDLLTYFGVNDEHTN